MCACALNSKIILVGKTTVCGYKMASGYRLKDLNKLKKSELIVVANNETITGIEKLTKQGIICALQERGLVAVDEKPVISPTSDTPFLSAKYKPIDNDGVALLPAITFTKIYEFCCCDATSFKNLDRAVKHKSAGHVNALKISQVRHCSWLFYVCSVCK
jgi:hypothetical protein